MPKTFLGVGVAFPIKAGPETGEILLAKYEESVRQSVWIILGTSKGERAMRPDLGAGFMNTSLVSPIPPRMAVLLPR